jgi:hypothetical protein
MRESSSILTDELPMMSMQDEDLAVFTLVRDGARMCGSR